MATQITQISHRHVIVAGETAVGQCLIWLTPSGVYDYSKGFIQVSSIQPRIWTVHFATAWLNTPTQVNKRGIKILMNVITPTDFPVDAFEYVQTDHSHACFISGVVKVDRGMGFWAYGSIANGDILNASMTIETEVSNNG